MASPSPGPVYLANFRAEGSKNLPGRPGEGEGRKGADGDGGLHRFYLAFGLTATLLGCVCARVSTQ